jgi:alpha,alpha-trehalose phosphorylase (configuration-retaining)
MWAGIAGAPINNNTQFEIAISIHDSVYNTDFASSIIPYKPGNLEQTGKAIQNHVLQTLRDFSSEHLCKFLGAGVTLSLLREVMDVMSTDLQCAYRLAGA